MEDIRKVEKDFYRDLLGAVCEHTVKHVMTTVKIAALMALGAYVAFYYMKSRESDEIINFASSFRLRKDRQEEKEEIEDE